MSVIFTMWKVINLSKWIIGIWLEIFYSTPAVNFDGELHNKMSADIITILAQLIGEGGLFGDGDDDGGKLGMEQRI